MCAARRKFAEEWWAWLATRPTHEDVEAEFQGTVGQIVGLTELVAPR